MARKPKTRLSPGYGQEPTEFRAIRLELQQEPKIRRVDNFLSQHYRQFSRNHFQKLIRAKELTVNGQTVAVSYRLQQGDVIECKLPVLPERVLKPWALPLDILYEDDDLFVISKPAGIICHPGKKPRDDTLASAFVYHMHGTKEGSWNPGIVHRLDVDTTGTMVVAKHAEAHAHLARQFERRTVHKEYIALVRGRIKRPVGRIDTPIGYSPKRWGLMLVGPEAARPKAAHSIYRVLERFRDYTLVAITLKTGRTHQIRVHFESIGHPVVADAYYRGDLGPDPLETLMPRLALHAWKLRIIHPTRSGPLLFTAPLPPDFAAALDHLRSQGEGART